MTLLHSASRGKRLYYQMCFAASLMFLLFGYDTGVAGGVINTPQFLSAMGYPQSTWIIPMIVASYTLAAFFACIPVMIFGMRLGRKRCLMIGCVLIVIGAAIQSTAFTVAHIIVGRIFAGFGMGFITATTAPYISEQSVLAAARGPSVCIMGSLDILGIPISYFLTYGTSKINSQFSWRFPIAFQAVFAIICFCIVARVPDTWYYARGRLEEGDDVLCKLFNSNLDEPDVAACKAEILAAISIQVETGEVITWRDWFWDRTSMRLVRRLKMCFLIMVFQQMTGINFTASFSTIIFARVGLDPNLSGILGGVMNTFFWLGTVPTIFTIERFGRRKILLSGIAACGVTLTIFVIMIALPNQTPAVNWTAVAFICIFNFIFGYSWIGMPWTYAAEIAPLHLRHIGMALAASGEWLFSFITTFTTPIAWAEPSVGWKIWIWFLVTCLITFVCIFYFYPETTGKTLEEIDLLFATERVRQLASGRVLDDLQHQHKAKMADLREK